jgi:hypothetical protein
MGDQEIEHSSATPCQGNGGEKNVQDGPSRVVQVDTESGIHDADIVEENLVGDETDQTSQDYHSRRLDYRQELEARGDPDDEVLSIKDWMPYEDRLFRYIFNQGRREPEPMFLRFRNLQRLNLVRLQNDINRINARVWKEGRLVEEDSTRLTSLLHDYSELLQASQLRLLSSTPTNHSTSKRPPRLRIPRPPRTHHRRPSPPESRRLGTSLWARRGRIHRRRKQLRPVPRRPPTLQRQPARLSQAPPPALRHLHAPRKVAAHRGVSARRAARRGVPRRRPPGAVSGGLDRRSELGGADARDAPAVRRCYQELSHGLGRGAAVCWVCFGVFSCWEYGDDDCYSYVRGGFGCVPRVDGVRHSSGGFDSRELGVPSNFWVVKGEGKEDAIIYLLRPYEADIYQVDTLQPDSRSFTDRALLTSLYSSEPTEQKIQVITQDSSIFSQTPTLTCIPTQTTLSQQQTYSFMTMHLHSLRQPQHNNRALLIYLN